ncbi:hypothetical protein OHS33_33580 [Streptomyces sp. NBC_00536]|uniref:hypothetical protein n=1 Tax=Streptomyces sp. NBC_00536 TaxID=2975769 RepID=UPI002E80AC54|nr:hypothetical protein [Streptomyces sp. NBC_00536]WUC82863.1 hypothetical protein OHS33_33580 [Streptomyces sp. NBC_00536]
MPTDTANGDSRLSRWLRVRAYAVPPSMIETATARRRTGDWAGACAAANTDVDAGVRPRAVARVHGAELAARLRADLRHLAPDLLRWHLPRVAPDGLLRPGLTVTLARYEATARDGPYPVHLVARTAPAWADGGQRISLALWDGSRSRAAGTPPHPHPRPHPRFRLDLHRHLWDARRTEEFRIRSGAGLLSADGPPAEPDPELLGSLPPGKPWAAHRWAAEAAILLRAEGRASGPVTVRLGSRDRLDLYPGDPGRSPYRYRELAKPGPGGGPAAPVLPDAATWVPPDLELLRAGLIGADGLHPLVASALVPGHAPPAAPPDPVAPGAPRLVECRGSLHRIGLVDGVLAALDHDPAEIRREELLVALTGTPLPCLREIDTAHRRPDCLTGVRERLDHGDTAGALGVVEGLLGPGAQLLDGPLRDALEAAVDRRITYGLFTAGLLGPGPGRIRPGDRRPRDARTRPRHATTR